MLINSRTYICILNFFSAILAVKGFIVSNGGGISLDFANIQDRYNDFLVGDFTQQFSSPPPPPPLPNVLSFDLPFLTQGRNKEDESQSHPGEFDKFLPEPASIINGYAVYGASFSKTQKESILSQQSDEEFKEAVFETIKLLGP